MILSWILSQVISKTPVPSGRINEFPVRYENHFHFEKGIEGAGTSEGFLCLQFGLANALVQWWAA